MLMNVRTYAFRLLCAGLVSTSLWTIQPTAGWSQVDSAGWHAKRSGLVAPLGIPLVLAGNFGELRADHFHTGLDFKTQGREGFPVIAASDGVISRVKVSPFGYGRAVYLNSPEGWTTVYAHLQKFTPEVESWVRERQYQKQRFALDESPKPDFVFSQGDTIGWSGNSGGSAGPHLHFEVRETATQRPVNPLFWGFDVSDAIPPELSGLWVLPTNGGRVNGGTRPQLISPETPSVRIEGEARFAVQALDRLDAARNRCGVYRAELRINDSLEHAWELDKLDFAVNRDMNALAYYPEWERTGDQVYRMHRLPGSRLPVHDAGTVTAASKRNDSLPVQLAVQLWDVHGNSTAHAWEVQWTERTEVQSDTKARLSFDEVHELTLDGATVRIPKNTFYEDFHFPFTWEEERDEWEIGSSDMPAARAVKVALPTAIPETTRAGVLAIRRGRDGDIEGTYAGSWQEDGRFAFSTKTCGRYALEWDSVPPTIRPHKRHRTSAQDTLVVRNFGELRFSVADDLSGIETWEGRLDGAWILMRWDPKRERIWYDLSDQKHEEGIDQELVIQARDQVGNQVVWRGTVRFE